VKRLATGLVLASLAVLAIKAAPALVLWAGLVFVAFVATEELRRILAAAGCPPWPVLAHFGTQGALLSFLAAIPPLPAVLGSVVIAAFVRALVPTQSAREGVSRIVGTLVPVLYIGLMLGHLGGLFPLDQGLAARERGEDLTLLLLCAVYFSDTFALYGGKLFGRHLMAPGISPKKTWEGAASGILGALAGGAVVHTWFFHALPLAHALVLSVLLALAGMAGDLGESLLKRGADVKDSGTFLPGHGGMLDRLDSLLLAAPIVYWYGWSFAR
jgi:phosphatidate cytidylyltransferase